MAGKGSAPGERRGGRGKGTPNKSTAILRETAGKYTVEAITELVKIARTCELPNVRVMAWKEVLDRGHGRPAQAITDADGGNLPAVPAVVNFIVRQAPGSDNRT